MMVVTSVNGIMQTHNVSPYITASWGEFVCHKLVQANSKVTKLLEQIQTLAERISSMPLGLFLIGPSKLLEPLVGNFGLLSDKDSSLPKIYRSIQGTPLGTFGSILALSPWTPLMNDLFILLGVQYKEFHIPFASLREIADHAIWNQTKNQPTAFGRELALLSLVESKVYESPLGTVFDKTGIHTFDIWSKIWGLGKIETLQTLQVIIYKNQIRSVLY